MTISAKFPSTCGNCHGKIRVGSQINYVKGQRATHTDCAAAAAENDALTPPVCIEEFQNTAEQDDILERFSTGRDLVIEAGAGTGKTATLRKIAQSTPRRGQYVAFNRSIVDEAAATFPVTCSCKTAHQLAYAAVGRYYQRRLKNSRRMKSEELARVLGLRPHWYTVTGEGGEPERRTVSAETIATMTTRTVSRYCASADDEISREHVPAHPALSTEQIDAIAGQIIPAAREMWADLQQKDGTHRFGHEHYLKMWALSHPTIDADYIEYDEAQDTAPVMADVVARQTCQKVYVGDSAQAINEWMGAVNALARIQTDNRAQLSQSFRFGQGIADAANEILARLNVKMRLTGREGRESTIGPITDPKAILTRTNAHAIGQVLSYQRTGRTTHLVGGGKDETEFCYAALDLMAGRPTDHRDLCAFSSWKSVCDHVKEDTESDLKLMVNLCNQWGPSSIISALTKQAPEHSADVTVSTAHKAKGRQWDSVLIGADFEDRGDDMTPVELRLLYVAITRAKYKLDMSAIKRPTEETSEEMETITA